MQAYVGVSFSYQGMWFPSYIGANQETCKPYSSFKDWQKILRCVYDVTFRAGTYDMWSATTNALIYCDPPYSGTLLERGCYIVKEFDHKSFWDWATKMSVKNRVFVSEISAPKDWKSVWRISRAWHGRSGSKTAPIKTEHLFVHESATWL